MVKYVTDVFFETISKHLLCTLITRLKKAKA